MEFLKFWWECLVYGWEWGDGLVEKVEAVIGFVGAAFVVFKIIKRYKHPHTEKLRAPNVSKSLSQRMEKWLHHKENKLMAIAAVAGLLLLLFMTICVAPFAQYKKEHEKSARNAERSEQLQKEINDKSPKLTGFIHRCLVADEPGTTNSLIFIEASIDNNGGSPSYADGYGLKVMLSKTASTNAAEIDFPDEYKMNIACEDKRFLLDLKRSELISEKTSKAIMPGDFKGGWAAFRLKGVQSSSYDQTNIIFSFLNIARKRIYVTNNSGEFIPCKEGLVKKMPGSENIFLQIEPAVKTNLSEWLPPELPPGCSNVTLFFGASGIIEPRQIAEISGAGTRFAIKDVPDYFLQNSDKLPGYSPRQQYMWLKSAGAQLNIGGKTISYPIQPVIISNRLYVEVEIPFTNEKRKLVMSDAFDTELSPLPLDWDRNYSTNYNEDIGIYAYEIVNELTNPVLQVVYTKPNEVHVNGIFQVDSNSILAAFEEQPVLGTFTYGTYDPTNGTTAASLQMENFHETLTLRSNETLASFGQRFTNEFFRPLFKYQKPFFKYPSNRNPGAFADWLLITNKSETNIVDKK
jgi:hypothetical protein